MWNKAELFAAMPNTPAMVQEGMTGVSLNKEQFSLDEIEEINDIFNSVGNMKIVDEKLNGCCCMCKRKFPGLCFYVY